jgi:hypothetical protein
VRPLNITNADTRLLASAGRLVLEPLLGPLITDDQRGFITGRSMIANLLDVDEAMLMRASQEEGACAYFFDFAAAFPSIEQVILREFFKSLGWPRWLHNFIQRLYQDNSCTISLGGARHDGFAISKGIRQGCPLSPLLFAAASDLMLRRMARLFPLAKTRAWADDLAMILPKGAQRAGELQDFFDDFANISGLRLNIP